MSLEDAAVPGLVTCRLVFGSVIGVLRKAQGVKQKLLGCGRPIQGSGTLDCQLNHCPLHVGVDESLTSKTVRAVWWSWTECWGSTVSFHRIPTKHLQPFRSDPEKKKKILGPGTSITPSASAQVDLSKNRWSMVPNFWDPPAPRGKELFTKLNERSASSSAERTFWVTQSGSHRHLGRPAEGFFVTSKPKVDLLSTLKTVVKYGKE